MFKRIPHNHELGPYLCDSHDPLTDSDVIPVLSRVDGSGLDAGPQTEP